MEKDTGGNLIFKPTICNCGLTSGCEECRVFNFPSEPKITPEDEKRFYREVFRTKKK